MGLLGGFLKQMNDTMQQNRRLLRKSDKSKSKQVREAYNEEIKRQASRYDHIDVEALKERVRKKVSRNIIQEQIIKAVAWVVLATIVVAVIWVLISFDFTVKKVSPYADTSKLFNSQIFPHENPEYKVQIDFYHHGSKAAESLIKNGLKHQHSESYYPSGEQFRSALYYIMIRWSGKYISSKMVIPLKIFHVSIIIKSIKSNSHSQTKNELLNFISLTEKLFRKHTGSIPIYIRTNPSYHDFHSNPARHSQSKHTH